MKLLIATLLLSMNALALTNSIAAEDKGWESDVLVGVPVFDDQGDSMTGYCNGTLIDAKTFITAAHCFLKSEITSKPITVQSGEYRYVTKPDGTKVKIGYKHTVT